MKNKPYRAVCFSLLAFFSASVGRGADTFTGPGLFTDTEKWNNKRLPLIDHGTDVYICGRCGVTNVAECLEGGKWCHLGGRSAAGYLEVENSHFKFREFRIARDGYTGVYRQRGGSLWMASTTTLGYSANYQQAGIVLNDVAVTNADVKIGNLAPKNNRRGSAYLSATKSSFKSSGTISTANGGCGIFDDCRITGGYLRPSNGSIALIGSVFTSGSEGALYPGASAGGVGTLAVTNSVLDFGEKNYLGGAKGACGELDLSGSFWTNKYQVYVGSAAGSTGIVRSANSVLTFNHEGYVGNGKNSFGEMVLGGGTKFKVASYLYVGYGSNAVGRLVYDGMNWADNSVNQYRFAYGVDSVGSVVYRNVEGRRQYPLAHVFSEANTNGYAETVFDNSHYSAGAFAYFGQTKRKARVSVVNGGTFDVVRDGDIWIPDAAGGDVRFFVTNSPLFRLQANELKHEKASAQLHLTFHDSTALICTNSTFLMAQGTGSKASITLSGASSVLIDTVNCYTAGESVFALNGGTLTLGRVTQGAPVFQFNGGTLRSKWATSSWIPAASDCTVLAGGAVLEASHTMTFPAALAHGGEAAKDGGLVKKGAGTLKLTAAAHSFTGDITVEDGVLDLTAISGYTLAAGQKIGGAGTLKVADGFTAGGISYTAGQSAPLTVDGAVSFAPDSTVELSGVEDVPEKSGFILLKADSIAGAQNISAEGMPKGWTILVKDTYVKAVRNTGMRLIIR